MSWLNRLQRLRVSRPMKELKLKPWRSIPPQTPQGVLLAPRVNQTHREASGPFASRLLEEQQRLEAELIGKPTFSSWFSSLFDRSRTDSLSRPLKVGLIGIHGWALLGGALDPASTESSDRYCQRFEQALRQHPKFSNAQVLVIPLVGHGFIERRVEKYISDHLVNFKDAIQGLDFFIVIGHSQGAVVGTLLLHNLLESQWTSPACRVGFLSLSGVFLGPFAGTPTDFWPATKELFVLSQPYSAISIKVKTAMVSLLDRGVQVAMFTSWRDEVVPLFSGTFQTIPSRKNLLRGIYVPVTSFQEGVDEFLVKLVSSLILLQNHSIDIHDSLFHLSGLIRGSILTAKAQRSHTLIHFDAGIYSEAVHWICGKRSGHNSPEGTSSSRFGYGGLWSEKFSDAFFASSLNLFLLKMSLEDTYDKTKRKEILGIRKQLEESFAVWQPKSHSDKVLRSWLGPLFQRAHVSKL